MTPEETVQMAAELRAARRLIHDLIWNTSVAITAHPELRDSLKAWGELDKLPTSRLDAIP
jgi:hypothetical protein